MEYIQNLVMIHSILILTASFLFIKKRKILKKTFARRWHVRPINQERRDHGMYHTTFQTMRMKDPQEFFRFTRMTVPLFDELCDLVKDDPLMKRSKRAREPVSVAERMAITLW
jgi:hypothetical protein